MPAPPTLQLLRGLAPALSMGVLTADLSALGSEVNALERAGARLAHFDVMDGCFCPMMTFGPPVIRALKTGLLKDVHLMISDPICKVQEFVAAGADIVTIHLESGGHPHRTLQILGGLTNANDPQRGLVRGVALNPGTPLAAIEPLLGEVELILLLAVNPGWLGQRFIPSTFERIQRAHSMIASTGKEILLGVDGGITRNNLPKVAQTGVDLIVTGSAVFDGKSPEANARHMLEIVRAQPSQEPGEDEELTDAQPLV